MKRQWPIAALSLLLVACTPRESSLTDEERFPGDASHPNQAADLARPDLVLATPPPDLRAVAVAVDLLLARDLATTGPDLAVPVAGDHRRCGWIGANDTKGYAVFAANVAYYDVIHPDWYAINSDSVTVRALAGADNTMVITAAKTAGVGLWPMIAGVEDQSWVRKMIMSSTLRATHIKNLVALAVNKGYVGLDIDYEHLQQSGDQAAFSVFMAELAKALHAVGKGVSVAASGLAYKSNSTMYDYFSLTATVDYIHIMGYDFHSVGTHAGPCAPLGWIDQVGTYAGTTGKPQKFILGLPNYGTTPSWFCATADCIAACGGTYSSVSTEMASCPFSQGYYSAAGRAPHCNTAHGTLYFDDTLSLEEKVASAKAHNLGGITYWTVGSEPPGFFTMVQKYY